MKHSDMPEEIWIDTDGHWSNDQLDDEPGPKPFHYIRADLASNDTLLDALATAIARMKDMDREDDGQAWKENRKAIPVLEAILQKAHW